MIMKYFDSHAHYYDERFAEELEDGADALLDSLFSGSVSFIVNVGTRNETNLQAIEQASRYDNMYTALGLHPTDLRYIDYGMDKALSELKALLLDKSSKCVALGEIGLDYHYPDTDKQRQREYFTAQMKLAEELSLPVVIHDRDAHGDVMDVIREFPNVKGVLHSFSGSVEMAEELVALGYLISFSGTLTFKNARRPKEVASAIPLSKILIETDAPYLAPHPKRGSLNHSGNLEFTNRELALIKGISEDECAKITEENARGFFKI